MAPPTTVLTVIKKFTYRTNTSEEWSNRYMLTGPTPADSVAWRALFDALAAQEKTVYQGPVSIIRGYGHNSLDPHATAVWSVDLRVAPNAPVAASGVFSPSAAAPGDTAVWVRWGLDRFVHGKRVYLRKYFHPAYIATSGGDAVVPQWTTAAQAFAVKMSDGSFLDGRKVTDKLGSAIVNTGVSAYATTRTLKKRPKRHPTSP